MIDEIDHTDRERRAYLISRIDQVARTYEATARLVKESGSDDQWDSRSAEEMREIGTILIRDQEDMDNAADNWNHVIEPVTNCLVELDALQMNHEGGPREAGMNLVESIQALAKSRDEWRAGYKKAMTLINLKNLTIENLRLAVSKIAPPPED